MQSALLLSRTIQYLGMISMYIYIPSVQLGKCLILYIRYILENNTIVGIMSMYIER